MTTSPVPSDVGFTAILTAGDRDRESSRADALFNDPLAAATIAYVESLNAPGDRSPRLAADLRFLYGDGIALRTRYFDERIVAAARAGASQIVVLASGLDGRSYRLDLPQGARIFEIDRPVVMAFKRQVVEQANLVEKVASVHVMADLAEDDWQSALREAGFVAARPTTWVVEGLALYLGMEAADRLVAQVTALSTPSSHLIIDYTCSDNGNSGAERLVTLAEQAGFDLREGFAPIKTMFASGPSEPPDTWFPRHGWRVEASTLENEAHRFGRPVPRCNDSALGMPSNHLVDAELLSG